jgi:outer membrane murein-binding lipoprotein Lpp
MIRIRTLRSFTAIAVLGLVPLVTSCSNKATEEQMKTLHDLDRQRDQLKTDLQHAQDNLRDAQGKLANADRDLADCQSDTRAAQAGLAMWPNVWPDSVDWRLAPPPPPVDSTMMKKKHHKTGGNAQ